MVRNQNWTIIMIRIKSSFYSNDAIEVVAGSGNEKQVEGRGRGREHSQWLVWKHNAAPSRPTSLRVYCGTASAQIQHLERWLLWPKLETYFNYTAIILTRN